MRGGSSIIVEAARRVWRCQRIVWWIFAINFLLSFLATVPLSTRIGRVTNHSLFARRLAHGFDVGAYSELLTTPDVALGSGMAESAVSVLVFVVFMLFLTGGILASYENEHRLSTREFFANCGAFFWRWVRLLLFMGIVLAPVGFAANASLHWSGKLISDAAGEKTGYIAYLAFALLTLFVMMVVRLWFDMAQVRAFVENEPSMRHSLARSFRLTFSNFRSLFWLYFRISFLAGVVLAIGLWLCTWLSGGEAIFIFEIVLLWWVVTRLWQRASEMAWYQRRAIAAAPLSFPVVAVPDPPLPEIPLSSIE
jgi:hypothetical protein